jgi:hypothetical protein
MPDWVARIVRTIIQLIAGGAFAQLFLQVAQDVPEKYAPYIALGSVLLVNACQNLVENATGKALLKPANAQHAEVKV